MEAEERRSEKTQKAAPIQWMGFQYFPIYFIRCHHRANHGNLRVKVGRGKVW